MLYLFLLCLKMICAKQSDDDWLNCMFKRSKRLIAFIIFTQNFFGRFKHSSSRLFEFSLIAQFTSQTLTSYRYDDVTGNWTLDMDPGPGSWNTITI